MGKNFIDGVLEARKKSFKDEWFNSNKDKRLQVAADLRSVKDLEQEKINDLAKLSKSNPLQFKFFTLLEEGQYLDNEHTVFMSRVQILNKSTNQYCYRTYPQKIINTDLESFLKQLQHKLVSRNDDNSLTLKKQVANDLRGMETFKKRKKMYQKKFGTFLNNEEYLKNYLQIVFSSHSGVYLAESTLQIYSALKGDQTHIYLRDGNGGYKEGRNYLKPKEWSELSGRKKPLRTRYVLHADTENGGKLNHYQRLIPKNASTEQHRTQTNEQDFVIATYADCYKKIKQVAELFLASQTNQKVLSARFEQADKKETSVEVSDIEMLQVKALHLQATLNELQPILEKSVSKKGFNQFKKLFEAYKEFMPVLLSESVTKGVTKAAPVYLLAQQTKEALEAYHTELANVNTAISLNESAEKDLCDGLTKSENYFQYMFSSVLSNMFVASSSIMSGWIKSDKKLTCREKTVSSLKTMLVSFGKAVPVLSHGLHFLHGIKGVGSVVVALCENAEAMKDAAEVYEWAEEWGVEAIEAFEGTHLGKKLVHKCTRLPHKIAGSVNKKYTTTNEMVSSMNAVARNTTTFDAKIDRLIESMIHRYKEQIALLTPIQAARLGRICANHIAQAFMMGFFNGDKVFSDKEFVKYGLCWLSYIPIQANQTITLKRGDRVSFDQLLKLPPLVCEDDHHRRIYFTWEETQLKLLNKFKSYKWFRSEYKYRAHDQRFGCRRANSEEVAVYRDNKTYHFCWEDIVQYNVTIGKKSHEPDADLTTARMIQYKQGKLNASKNNAKLKKLEHQVGVLQSELSSVKIKLNQAIIELKKLKNQPMLDNKKLSESTDIQKLLTIITELNERNQKLSDKLDKLLKEFNKYKNNTDGIIRKLMRNIEILNKKNSTKQEDIIEEKGTIPEQQEVTGNNTVTQALQNHGIYNQLEINRNTNRTIDTKEDSEQSLLSTINSTQEK